MTRKLRRTISFPAAPHLVGLVGVVEEVEDAAGALLDGVDEIAGLAVDDLEGDAADVAGDDGPAFQRPSVTERPKPSRTDFWMITRAPSGRR